MKTLFSAALASILFSATAFADQTVTCREIGGNFAYAVGGGELTLNLATKLDGALDESRPSFAVAKNFLRQQGFPEFQVQLVAFEEKKPLGERASTVMLFAPPRGDGSLFFQFQTNFAVLGQQLRGEPAVFAIVKQSPDPSKNAAIGFNIACESN